MYYRIYLAKKSNNTLSDSYKYKIYNYSEQQRAVDLLSLDYQLMFIA